MVHLALSNRRGLAWLCVEVLVLGSAGARLNANHPTQSLILCLYVETAIEPSSYINSRMCQTRLGKTRLGEHLLP